MADTNILGVIENLLKCFMKDLLLYKQSILSKLSKQKCDYLPS